VTDIPTARVSGGAVPNAYLLDELWTVGGPSGLIGAGLAWLAPAAYAATALAS
jgi:hypothetical protein